MKKEEKGVIKVIQLLVKTNPMLAVSVLLESLMGFGVIYIGILLPRFLIDAIMRKVQLNVMIVWIILAVTLRFVLSVVKDEAECMLEINVRKTSAKIEEQISKKCMYLDFEKLEDPKLLDLKEKAVYPLTNQNVVVRISECFLLISEAIWITLGTVPLMVQANSYVLIILIALGTVNIVFSKKIKVIMDERYSKIIPINRKMDYYTKVSQDFTYAKDIRLYRQDRLLLEKYHTFLKSLVETMSFYAIKAGRIWAIIYANNTIQMLISYTFFIYETLISKITIGQLSSCLSASNSFCNAFDSLISNTMLAKQYAGYMDYYFEFEKLETVQKSGTLAIPKLENYTIDFDNVSFRYPGAENYTLKKISITIHPNEKLSVVGLNGAGKTTFIKLLMRLYEPTEGRIMLNSLDIRNYKYEEYVSLLSVVFQDFKMFAMKIKENITLQNSEEIDEKRIFQIVEKVGLNSIINSTPYGLNSTIHKIFDDEGIELSGGQYQKLALTRALYKECPIVILDEPTSALDPYSEYEVYSSFNILVENKTTIYISHRLSSCKFCDKIAVFHNGSIIEYGSHNNLILNKNGNYYKMYQTQAQYYQ